MSPGPTSPDASSPDRADDRPDGDRATRTDEVWTFAGRRIFGGKRSYAWQDQLGHERYFKKTEALTVGGRYAVVVERDGNTLSLCGTPRYTGQQTDDQTRREMEALDITAAATLAAQARDRNDARRKALDDALQPLADIAAKLAFGHERDAFLAYVIRRLAGEWRQPTATK